MKSPTLIQFAQSSHKSCIAYEKENLNLVENT